MNLADVFTVVLVVFGLLAAFIGCWLMVTGLFANRVARCATAMGEAPITCIVIGLAGAVPLIALGVLAGRIAQSAPAKLGAFVIIFATILIGLFGVAGLALRIGQGLPSSRDASEPWRMALRGGIVLALTYGTFVMLPFTLLLGFGAFILSARRRGPHAPVSSPGTP